MIWLTFYVIFPKTAYSPSPSPARHESRSGLASLSTYAHKHIYITYLYRFSLNLSMGNSFELNIYGTCALISRSFLMLFSKLCRVQLLS